MKNNRDTVTKGLKEKKYYRGDIKLAFIWKEEEEEEEVEGEGEGEVEVEEQKEEEEEEVEEEEPTRSYRSIRNIRDSRCRLSRLDRKLSLLEFDSTRLESKWNLEEFRGLRGAGIGR
ncbi:hypothetical protein M0802_014120 [Mischocyttarus mexicanus]|nr:hypothetical protein M0802_014120 [Mischocyttarus mexicanus]